MNYVGIRNEEIEKLSVIAVTLNGMATTSGINFVPRKKGNNLPAFFSQLRSGLIAWTLER